MKALLFGTTQPNIAMHIRNIFDDGELEIGATYKDFLYVQTEGGKQKSRYIKIDATLKVDTIRQKKN